MTIETEAKINAVSSSIICKFLRGTAKATEVTGKTIGITGAVTGNALIATGKAICNSSEAIRDKSEVYAEALRAKADKYDLSEFTTEELAAMLEANASKHQEEAI